MRDIDTAFAALNQQVSTAVRPPAPAEIIRRARRRTGLRAVVASIVAAATLGGGAVFAVPGDEPTPRPTPTPSVSESSPAPTPSTSPSSPPPSSPPAKAPREPQPVAGDIPGGFLLYDDDPTRGGVPDRSLNGPSWCTRTEHPELTARTSRGSEPDADDRRGVTEHFHVFPDESRARRAMEIIRTDCRKASFDVRRMNIGDGALKLVSPAGGPAPYGGFLVRRGIAIAEYHGSDFARMESDARRIAKRMCRYDPNCRPADGFPNPVRDERGGTYWVTVLAVGQLPGSSLMIGKAIAEASEAGYSISVRDPKCDLGASEAMKLKPDKDYEYVVGYFASDDEARQFLDRYEPPVLFLFEVEASCRD